MPVKVGVLALQGAVQPHVDKLRGLGVEPVEVRKPADLAGLGGIILPGGESTTMLHLLKLNSLWNPLKEFVATHPTWGVCAGCILLARSVSHPAQESLGAIDIAVERNAFGRQVDSFIDHVQPEPGAPIEQPVEAVFIRAPRISEVGAAAQVVLRWKGEPVMVEQGDRMAATFHPELTADDTIHRHFVEKCRKAQSRGQSRG